MIIKTQSRPPAPGYLEPYYNTRGDKIIPRRTDDDMPIAEKAMAERAVETRSTCSGITNLIVKSFRYGVIGLALALAVMALPQIAMGLLTAAKIGFFLLAGIPGTILAAIQGDVLSQCTLTLAALPFVGIGFLVLINRAFPELRACADKLPDDIDYDALQTGIDAWTSN